MAIGVLSFVLSGCESKSDDKKQAAKTTSGAAKAGAKGVPSTPAAGEPLAIAHEVLKAYKAKQWKRLADLAGNDEEDLPATFEKSHSRWRKTAIDGWDGKAPTQLRYFYAKGTHAESTEAIIGFTFVGEDDRASVRLRLKAGKWRFHKLVRPHTTRYLSMAKTLDEARKRFAKRVQDRQDRTENQSKLRAELVKQQERTMAMYKKMAEFQLRLSEAQKEMTNAKTADTVNAARARLEQLKKQYKLLRDSTRRPRGPGGVKKPGQRTKISDDCKNNPLCAK